MCDCHHRMLVHTNAHNFNATTVEIAEFTTGQWRGPGDDEDPVYHSVLPNSAQKANGQYADLLSNRLRKICEKYFLVVASQKQVGYGF